MGRHMFRSLSGIRSGRRTNRDLSIAVIEVLENRQLLDGVGIPSQLAFVDEPGNAAAGASTGTITVAIEDDTNAVVTSDTSNVTLSVGSGPTVTLAGTLTVAAVNGIATFTGISLNTAGTYTLTANDTADSLPSDMSDSFVISPGTASTLVYAQQPGLNTAGNVFPAIVVDVEDGQGNIVTSDNSTLSLAISNGPSGALLNGSLTMVSVQAVNGVATFGTVSLNAAGTYTLSVADTADSISPVNSDGFTVFPGAASQLTFVQQPTNTTAGVAISPALVLDVQDDFGNLDTLDSNPVTVNIVNTSIGTGLQVGTLTGAFVNGVATFSGVTLNTAGTYTLSAGDLNDGLTLNSDSFVVSPGTASTLVFVQQPTGTAAGVAISPQVAVEDQFGNVITNDNSNVTLAISTETGTGTLAGTLTVPVVNGIATFSGITLNTAGNYTLSAIDAGDTLGAVQSGSFAIAPASASTLVFVQQPTNATAGVAFSPALVVDVEDAFGNVVTSDNSSVALAIQTGTGTLAGTLTAPAVNGVVTFTGVSLNTAGNYTLSATDTTDDLNVTSGTFAISPAAASTLVFAQQPTGAAVNSAISPAIIVDIDDAFGNIVTSDDASVTLSITNPSGTQALAGSLTVTAVNGVATFTGISLNTVGTYTLTAGDTADSLTATSDTFAINPMGAPSTLVFVQQPASAIAGASITPPIAVAIEDSFGDVVTTDDSNVTLAVNTGSGTLGGTLTVAAFDGVATFTGISVNTAGSFTLSASDTADTLAAVQSNGFTVSPAAAATLVFVQQPTSAIAGASITPPIQVAIEDSFGDVVTSDDANVTLAINTGSGTLGGTLTVAAFDGVATFTGISVNTAGSFTLSASDTADTLAAVQSNGFTISPATASTLVFVQQPTSTTAGVAISPAIVVDIDDSLGNVLTSDNSNVTLTVNTQTGTAVTTGTLTVAAVNGVATFTGVTVDTAGILTITATDTADTLTATSGSFTVVPAAASTLVFVQEPTGTAAGTSISPGILVAVEDRFGNIITTDTSNITIAANNQAGTSVLHGTLTETAVNGVATFTGISVNTAGTFAITASDTADTLGAVQSSTFTIGAAPVVSLVIVQQPTSGAAGSTLAPPTLIKLEDTFGNVVTNDNSAVTLTLAGTSGAVLSGTTTVNAVDGLASFNNLSINTAGTYMIVATDSTDNVAGTSGAIAIASTPAVQLVFKTSPPGKVTAGKDIRPSVVVDVEQNGKVDKTDDSDVTLFVDTGPAGATLGGTVTVAAKDGVATFSDVALDTAGSYSFIASDTSGATAVSKGFAVIPAAANHVVVTLTPTSVTAGSVISPAITVTVTDAFGNPVADKTAVTLSLFEKPKGAAITGTATEKTVGGVATFSNIALKTAGAYVLEAKVGKASGESSGLTVNPGAVAKLKITKAPSHGSDGVALTPALTVVAEDQFGNVITGSLVTLSLLTGPSGGLGGTLTATTDGTGVATFSNIVLSDTGTYVLNVSDTVTTKTGKITVK
jgi:NADH/NAD ratio-sensing transcriptional regulator Rex